MILIGNGGAALALATSLSEHLNLTDLTVLRRSNVKDANWKRLLSDRVDLHFQALDADHLKAAIERVKQKNLLLVQATSAPVRGERLESLLPGMTDFNGVFVDLVYGVSSALLDWVRKRKIPSQDGLPMLVGQALRSQKLWWGQSLDLQSTVEWILREKLISR